MADLDPNHSSVREEIGYRWVYPDGKVYYSGPLMRTSVEDAVKALSQFPERAGSSVVKRTVITTTWETLKQGKT